MTVQDELQPEMLDTVDERTREELRASYRVEQSVASPSWIMYHLTRNMMVSAEMMDIDMQK